MKYLPLALAFPLFLLTVSSAWGQEARIEGLPADACRDYANAGYGCCVYVRGHRDSPLCAAEFHGHQSHATQLAIEGTAHFLVHRLGHTASSLRLTPVSALVGNLIVQRLDLTGVDGLMSAAVARCMNGESVARGPGVTFRGNSRYSNPHYWEGPSSRRLDQTEVHAYLTGLRGACRQQVVAEAVRHVQRPRANLEWCGRLVTERGQPRLTGPTPPDNIYVRPTYRCSGRAPLCCWRRYLVSTSNAYCETDPLPNDGYDRECIPNGQAE